MQGDMKASWKAINEMINKMSKSTNSDISNCGQEISHEIEIAIITIGYFCTTADLARTIEKLRTH